ncbi:MAG: NAD(P)-binding protein [Candidatus Poseidoniaceae archaeon]|nr:NAD(P)-binding protein [Candidatus Poseidoniaceae archaeon]
MVDVRLPDHLDERCIRHHGPDAERPTVVVHWMRAALRLDENPTFDVARTMAKSLGLPLVVYQAIDERYPHASYRHHRFLLEGAADVAHRAERLGVKHVLHVARNGHRQPALLRLAESAAVVVTDLVDLEPWRTWTEAVARVRHVIEVDAHCVLPRPVFGRTADRPFRFKDATKREMKRRMGQPWPRLQVDLAQLPESWTPPFTPVDAAHELRTDGARGMLSTCRIDPTVVPVEGMIGGASAGMARWKAYLDDGLSRYHRTRNNAALRQGVSGMSPWLHHGMVAATRLVRDAAEHGTKGAEKFLDEMLVFREHAYHHAHDVDRPHAWDRLPDWARASWRRSALVHPARTAMELERGRSDDALWNAAQVGLVRHGVMHNNVRMTWGKGTVRWMDDPEAAMRLTQDLNDRYALDGRNPNSLAGVMWCYGLFDRPFDPPEARMGRVRRRDPRDHAARLDMNAYREWTEAPAGDVRLNVGVVGGGLSGRFAARLLSDLGHSVTVYDKGRRASGRLSDRTASDGTPFQLGAPKVDGWPEWAERYLQDWVERGYLDVDGEHPLTTLPPLLDHLGDGIDVRQLHRVDGLEITPEGGRLRIISPEGPLEVVHDHVLVAAPFEQSRALLDTAGIDVQGRSEPCWVAWGPAPDHDLEAPQGWTLTHRGADGRTLEVRMDAHTSAADLERSLPDMAAHVATTLGVDPHGWSAHRWRFSRPIEGPETTVQHGPFSVIGDAFGSPIGTAGAALDSAARAVANLHCATGWHPAEVGASSQQTDLSTWGS